jgi:hypothetical protein
MNDIIQILSTLSPVGLAGMLAYIIYLLIKGRTAADAKVETIASNHLHELPELVDTSRKIIDVLQRIENRMVEDFTVIKAKLEK